MEPALTLDEEVQTKKIYTERAIYLGTFLGGPLVSGYCIANNYKVFNEPEKARKTWIYAIIATVIILGGALLISSIDKFPNQLIPLIYAGIAYYLVKAYQRAQINTYVDSGGQVYSWWRTILIAIIGCIVTILPLYLYIVLSSGIAQTKNYSDEQFYGAVKNEIFYNKKVISNNEVNKIADALTTTKFFTDNQKKAVYVKENGTDYIISIGITDLTNRGQLFAAFKEFRDRLQALLPRHKIIISLVQNSLDNEIKRFE